MRWRGAEQGYRVTGGCMHLRMLLHILLAMGEACRGQRGGFEG